MDLHLPIAICFRVTRYCNARCGFCLAPPDGAHPPAAVLTQRLDWLMARGVRTIHFCGGEPTIHPALAELLAHVQGRGAGSRLTTNGIALPEPLLAALRAAGTRVKVSLHGDRAHHDAMVGRAAFDLTTQHLRRLLAAGIPTSVQTTLVAGGEWVLGWMADFCLAERVRQLSILPFIPRGSGFAARDKYGLTSARRTQLREEVRRRRHALQGRLDLRWLDFSARPIHVVEADGRVVLERASEAMDTELCTIPGDAVPRKRVAIRLAGLLGRTRASAQAMQCVLAMRRAGAKSKSRISIYLAGSDSDSDDASTLAPLQAAARPCRPRRARGPAPGQTQKVHWTVCVRARPTGFLETRVVDQRRELVLERQHERRVASCGASRGASLSQVVARVCHKLTVGLYTSWLVSPSWRIRPLA